MTIESAAGLAVAQLEGNTEAVSYLAESLAYYLPSADRGTLAQRIADITTQPLH
jgi:hypothetical protein